MKKRLAALTLAFMMIAGSAQAATSWSGWRDGDGTLSCAPGKTIHVQLWNAYGNKYQGEINTPGGSRSFTSQTYSGHAYRNVEVDTGYTFGWDPDGRSGSTTGSTKIMPDSVNAVCK